MNGINLKWNAERSEKSTMNRAKRKTHFHLFPCSSASVSCVLVIFALTINLKYVIHLACWHTTWVHTQRWILFLCDVLLFLMDIWDEYNSGNGSTKKITTTTTSTKMTIKKKKLSKIAYMSGGMRVCVYVMSVFPSQRDMCACAFFVYSDDMAESAHIRYCTNPISKNKGDFLSFSRSFLLYLSHIRTQISSNIYIYIIRLQKLGTFLSFLFLSFRFSVEMKAGSVNRIRRAWNEKIKQLKRVVTFSRQKTKRMALFKQFSGVCGYAKSVIRSEQTLRWKKQKKW